MSIILNKSELATSKLRKDALDILEAGLEAVDTEKTLRKKLFVRDGFLFIKNGADEYKVELPSPNLGEGLGPARHASALSDRQQGDAGGGEVYFIGIGKCALDGAKVIEEILGDRLTAGAVIDVKPKSEFEAAFAKTSASRIKYFEGTHPLPSEQNILATKEILKMVENLSEKDLVITLISGGGSSLFELPDEAAAAKLGLPGETALETVARITKELTAKGADIYELNAARKEMSQVKGGKFAKLCAPAQVVSFIFSDVLGNDISVIASGPTAIDSAGPSVQNFLICSNHDALSAMKSKAEDLGYDAAIETEKFSGNAAEFGKELSRKKMNSKTCLLLGGETTVKIHEDHGVGGPARLESENVAGGRNQELALSALLNIPENEVIISAASDGWDNTDHAGAIADAELFDKSKQLGLDAKEYLDKSDSYNFFKKVGDGAISTGRLGSNVSDLVIILYESPAKVTKE